MQVAGAAAGANQPPNAANGGAQAGANPIGGIAGAGQPSLVGAPIAGFPQMPVFGMMPPFGQMPPMPPPPPFLVPPPPIPENLAVLSDEELRLLEGTERRNVEERLKLLYNVQTLMDAAAALMVQYTAISTKFPIAVPVPGAAAAAPATGTAEAVPSTSSAGLATNNDSSSSVNEGKAAMTASVVSDLDKITISDVPEDDEEVMGAKPAAVDGTATTRLAVSEEEKEAAEVRRRRLERFSMPSGSGTADQQPEQQPLLSSSKDN